MVDRVLLTSNPPRLITSKAGKNASTSLPDADKSFDSNWFEGGGLKWILPRNKTGNFTAFPYTLNYIPFVWGYSYGVYNGNQSYFADQYIQNASDRPPRGTNGARFIRSCENYWYGDASQVYRATNTGIYNQSRNDIPEITHFIVFEG